MLLRNEDFHLVASAYAYDNAIQAHIVSDKENTNSADQLRSRQMSTCSEPFILHFLAIFELSEHAW